MLPVTPQGFKSQDAKIRPCLLIRDLLKRIKFYSYDSRVNENMNLKQSGPGRGKKLRYWLFFILLLSIFVPAIGFLVPRLEGESPRIDLKLDSPYIRAKSEIPVQVADMKSGIRSFRAVLVRDGKEIVLKEANYQGQATQHHADFTLEINAKQLELPQGKVVLRIKTADSSWRRWLHGNVSYVDKELYVDTSIPRITVLSRQHNVSRGGAGLVVYRLSEPCARQGVRAGNEFYPGHSGYFDDPSTYLAFFALRHDQGPGTDLHLEAADAAGNVSKAGFYHYIRDKQFKSDTLSISDSFLGMILPNFQLDTDVKPDATPVEQFLYINNKLRKNNDTTILSNGRHTNAKLYWEGPFLRLPNSAPRAAYADHRIYKYNNEVVDQQYHLGIDLASVQQAPIPAANNGRVAFIGQVGIYGIATVIDHGFGIFSVYGHMSRTTVNVGDMIRKGDVIGYSGSTGLAAGDHLHYSVFIDHVFVNPVEWWDSDWIKNNITMKLDDAGMLGSKTTPPPVGEIVPAATSDSKK